MKRESFHLEAVDALRGIACAMVVLLHTGGGIEGQEDNLFAFGARGVQLFYVLSAFTLFLSLENKATLPLTKGDIASYFLRRVLRIVPLFYAVCIPSLYYAQVLSEKYPSVLPLTAVDVSSTFLFFNAWLPWSINRIVKGGWSVAIEMSFYLIVPLLYVWLRTFRRTLLFFVGSVAVGIPLSYIGYRIALIHGTIAPRFYEKFFGVFWLPVELPVFTLGVLLYHFIRQPEKTPGHPGPRDRWEAWTKAHPGLSKGLVWGAAVSLTAVLFASHLVRVLKPGKVLGSAAALAFFATWVIVKSPKFWVNRFTMLLGKVSFSMYLIHFFVLNWTYDWTASLPAAFTSWPPVLAFLAISAIRFAMTLAIAIAISWVTFHLIEKPGMDLAKKIERRFLSKKAGVTEPSPARSGPKSASPEAA